MNMLLRLVLNHDEDVELDDETVDDDHEGEVDDEIDDDHEVQIDDLEGEMVHEIDLEMIDEYKEKFVIIFLMMIRTA